MLFYVLFPGATIPGGILTGWSFCCSLVALGIHAAIKWLPKQLSSQFLSKLTPSHLKGWVKLYIVMTAAAVLLAIATGINGIVVLSQYAGASPFYVFNGFVQFIPTFLYIGLGAGNLGLGVIALIIDVILIVKLYRYYSEIRRTHATEKVTKTVNVHEEEATPTDWFARVPQDDFASFSMSPPPSYHSDLKEEFPTEYISDPQFAFSTYAHFIDVVHVVDEGSTSTSSILQPMETKL